MALRIFNTTYFEGLLGCGAFKIVFRILLLAWILAFVFVALAINKSLIQVAECIGILIGFTLWGHVVVWPLLYKQRDILGGMVWGSIIGIPLSAFITSIIVYLIGWNVVIITFAIFLVPSALSAVLLIKSGFKREDFRRSLNSESLTPVILVWLIISLFYYRPTLNFGAVVGDRLVFAWLYGHDFLNRLVHIVSLSNGIPLSSYFFSGETLSYYWLAYVYPALLHNIHWIWLDVDDLLQIALYLYGLIVAGGFVLFIRWLTKDLKSCFLFIILVFCCYSFTGLFYLSIKYLLSLKLLLRMPDFGLNFEAYSGFSHTFYRFFLVQPQSLLAVGVILFMIFLDKTREGIYASIVIGLLLGLLFGVEATNAIMVAAWYGVVILIRLARSRMDLRVLMRHSIAVLVSMVIYASLFGMDMYNLETGKAALKFEIWWPKVLISPIYFVLEYGPLFIMACGGIWLMSRQKKWKSHWEYEMAILLGISLFFVFFVSNPTEKYFGLLKATRIVPISLIPLAVLFLKETKSSKYRNTALVVACALSIPSIFVDNYLASDIENPSTFILKGDLAATHWLRENVPEEAIIQAEPNYPGKYRGVEPEYYYSLIPIFAHRRTAIGEWKVAKQEHGRPQEVKKRYEDIKIAYSVRDSEVCERILNKYDIQYIYVGMLEKRLYPLGIKKFFNNSRFEMVYSNNGVSIFKYKLI